ncbi:MAG: vanadium-dependent haloperoxidase [Bacteroidota bacterium]|nr:vanadium-dependent haloperoxidase [Bacteroidota bacterium]
MMFKRFFVLSMLVIAASCNNPKKEALVEVDMLHNSVQYLTDVIVHDIFSPPVASRIYAYTSISAYEILALKDPAYKSLAGQLNGLESIPEPTNEINYDIAAVDAYLLASKKLIFSEEKIIEFREQWHKELLDQNIDEDIFNNSIVYSETVVDHIFEWANKDNYKQTRTFQKYSVTHDEGKWVPTPPAYIEAIEPHWGKMRPFVMDSASQFKPQNPNDFSIEIESKFMTEVMEVYETTKNLNKEQKEIAAFWDCNPFVMNIHGHVMFATKKISPGGHWMGIAKIACQKDNANMIKSAYAYALTSISLADGFISCWEEKYKQNLIRPETVINKYIDQDWAPLLQTPPFPEYPSGHSVISGAAGVALTSIFGDSFHFVDDTEEKYGLTTREFPSFNAASEEAALSRMYGGIHYMPAITNGLVQGRSLGSFIVDKIDVKENAAANPSMAMKGN